jgi:TRAP-type mannitol/chloroaromatic compound transport system permease small subunit
MVKALEIAAARLGKFRWFAFPVGLLASVAAVACLWFLFALKDYSSNLRDAYEAPPGPIQYFIFSVLCVSFLLLLVGGIASMVLGLRRARGA